VEDTAVTVADTAVIVADMAAIVAADTAIATGVAAMTVSFWLLATFSTLCDATTNPD